MTPAARSPALSSSARLARALVMVAWGAAAGLSLAWAPGARAGVPTATPSSSPLEQALSLYVRGDHASAARAFEHLATLGVPAADYNLAVMHLRSEHPAASAPMAWHHLSRAAQSGFVTAMFALGQLHERGWGDAPKDLVKAVQWFLKAAQAGSLEAQVEAGTAYYLGRGVAKDLAQAAHWYRQAAQRGDAGAQYLLASMYETGHGLQRDLRLAAYWYAACAAQGDPAAQGKLRALEARQPSGAPD